MSSANVVESTPDLAARTGCSAVWEARARRFGWIAIVVCVGLAYANSFQSPFIFDGANYLKDGETVRTLRPLSQFVANVEALKAMSRIVTYFTFACDYALGELLFDDGYEVRLWHTTSTLIHLAGALALYGVARHGFTSFRARDWFGGVAERAALVTALLWGVHPLNTQSVTYLYQRQESLMGMFYLLTLYLFTRFASTGRIRWAAASLAACALGMGAKEVMVTAPLVVLWYDLVFCSGSWSEFFRRRGLYYVLLFATIGVAVGLMLWIGEAYRDAGILDTRRITPMEYALTQPGIILRYLRLTFFPYGLNIDYAWPKAVTWPWPTQEDPRIIWWPTEADWGAVLRPLTVLVGVLMLTVILMIRRPAVGFLAGAFFVTLAPSSSFAPIVDLCFEHRMYLSAAPLMALSVVAVHMVFRTAQSRPKASPRVLAATESTATVGVVIALIGLTLLRNYDYRSELALWRDSAAKAPRNHRAQYNYGVYLQIDGQAEEAIAQYHKALELQPSYVDANLNLAGLAFYYKRYDDAVIHYDDILVYEPDNEKALYGLAEVAKERGDPVVARYHLDRLLAAHPNHADGQAMRREVQADMERLRQSPPFVAPTPAVGPTRTATSGPSPSAATSPNAPPIPAPRPQPTP